MVDCFPPEADDLHRPLPLAAMGVFADTEAVADVPTEADVVGVEELAVQLAAVVRASQGRRSNIQAQIGARPLLQPQARPAVAGARAQARRLGRLPERGRGWRGG
ncbi:unnamed protein product [Urochloa humidicola]